MSKTKMIAIVATGIIVALVLIVSNFNIEINVNSNKDDTAKNNVQQTQANSMDSHHGGGAPVDSTVFNGLVGKSAPDFTLENYDGKKVTLSGLKGQNIILFFNEGLMCYPSCWNQIAAFGKDSEISKKAVILSITVDPQKDWNYAVNKMPELAKATVLFDTVGEVSKSYGVLTLPSSMHKGQYPGHSYVLIDKEGVVKFVRDDVSMAVRNSELSAELEKI
jgi:peroxiredoxin